MFRKNVAGQFIHFQGVDTTTGGIKSGVTWTVRRCIDGTFAAATGTVTEDGTTGWYKFALSQADVNGNDVGFNFTGTGAVPQTINIVTTALDPTSTAFGLSLAKTTNITGFNDIAATAVVSSGAITTSGGAVSIVTAVTTVTNLTNAPTAGDLTTTMKDSVAAAVLVTPANKLATDASGRVTEVSVDGIQKNTALNNFEFLMIDSTDGKSPKTGLTVTPTRSIDGAAFAACANTVTEVANGIYKINLATTDLNGDVITLQFAATGALTRFVTIKTNA